ncbi:Transcription elongation factor spt6 [Trichostrongylus colubriformis]|uniref:Suppressor of Ty 6 homolog n=1 Tax=Trichostrongylus colubriformis TaxID=6319 RepID=A0AAN8FFJ5_TRICO
MDYIERQAEESDGEESSSGSTDNEQPKAKKRKVQKEKKKSKRVVESDDEEEEDDDDEEGAEEMRGFIADEEEEDDVDDDKSEKSEKLEDEEDELDDDDIDLIQENLGNRKEKKQRIIQPDDSDEDVDDRTAIQKKLFGENFHPLQGDDGEGPSSPRDEGSDAGSERDRYSDSEQSEDNFIVNEDGGRHTLRHHRRRDGNMPEGALDEARDVFGVEDFNFDEFYDEDEEPVDEEDEEQEDLMDDEGEGEARVRRARTKEKSSTLLDTMEPSELERGFMAPLDKKIQLEDKPERFQLRRTPVTEADDMELELESKWIYYHAFCSTSISNQKSTILGYVNDYHGDDRSQCEDEARETIKEALKFMRNHLFEVPFIAFYRKELVNSVLPINDLWKVYEWDEKWCHLQSRKKKLVDLMKRMQYYQTESLQNYRRVVSDDDIIEVQNVDTVEVLGDLSAQFHLYYGAEVGRMLDWEAAQKDIDEGGDGTNVHGTRFRQSTRNDRYQLCVDNGIGEMVARFGITARQLAENLDWKKHDVEQDPVAPKIAAADYTSSSFPTPETVIAGAIYMMARELSREPAARERVRAVYRRNVKLYVHPTPKGREHLDETSPVWKMRYVKGKPVSRLEEEEYLYYHQAKVAEHLEIKFVFEKEVDDSMVVRSLSDALLAEQPYRVDEFSEVVEEWNSIREKAMRMAIDEMVLPFLEKELEEKLLEEAKESVLLKCAKAMYTRLEPAAFQPSEEQLEDEDEDVARQGEVRVMAIAYPTDFNEASFGVLVDQDGAVIDYCRMVHFLKRSGGYGPNQVLKAESMNFFKKFVERRRPHVIGLCGENLESIRLRRDLEECLNSMVADGEISRAPPVYILDNEAAKVYMLSKGAITEHSGYPPTLLQAISLARLLLDPLWEYAHLWNADDDIFCLNFHPLQSEVSKDDLSNALSRELINRVNEVGVDVNRCLEHPHTANVLQFVCGLGPRKATHLLKMLKQHDHLLESRTKLVTLCRMGPKVFMNCAGFIKIDTTRVAEKTDAYVEVLDGSRVHPETYEWARKMAVDALEVDDSADPTTALEEILQAPDRLKDLDLDAFAEELKRQGFGEKKATLYDISAELNHRYKDQRRPFVPLSDQELFELLTKESKNSLVEEKRVCGVVTGVQFKKIPEDQRAAYISGQEHMQRIQESEYWECSFCRMPITSSKLYEHLEIRDSRKGGCPGIPVGIRVKLDNGISGFIPNKMISDKPESFKNPLERVKMNQPIYCRIVKLEPEKFSCLLSCRTSDLNKEPATEHDSYWDYELEKEDIEKDRSAKSLKAECNFTHRQIVHPLFHNVSYREAQRMLNSKDTGDLVIRPSAKSTNRLTISWKVTDGVVANIDVEEHDKDDPTELGRRLTILGEDFDDLDEAIARFLYPMADLCRDVMSYKYFMDGVFSEERDRIDARLRDEKRASPSRIPYVLTASRTYPAKFVISYLARVKPCHEYISVTSEGLKFRQKFFSSLDSLLAWFKVHFREPPPGVQHRR